MSDTPRTDAETWRDEMDHVDTEYTFAQSATVSADFARQLERELAAKTSEFDRLNESLAKNKRLFSNALADGIIESQLKRIKQLEDHLSLALQAMDNLRQSMRGGAP
jgi:hypothetical protein